MCTCYMYGIYISMYNVRVCVYVSRVCYSGYICRVGLVKFRVTLYMYIQVVLLHMYIIHVHVQCTYTCMYYTLTL